MRLAQSISVRLGTLIGRQKIPSPFAKWVTGVAIVGVFLMDLLTPLGFADGILYIVPLLLTMWVEHRAAPLYVTVAATAAIVAGGFLSPPGIQPAVGWLNRGVNIMALWIAAGLALRAKYQTQDIGTRLTTRERMVFDLEHMVAERTQKLEEANRALQVEVTEHRLIRGWLEESQEQLRNLANRLESVREEEAGRMAREVHDVLGQMLTALKLDVVRMSREQADRQGPLADRLRALSLQIDTINDGPQYRHPVAAGGAPRPGVGGRHRMAGARFCRPGGLAGGFASG